MSTQSSSGPAESLRAALDGRLQHLVQRQAQVGEAGAVLGGHSVGGVGVVAGWPIMARLSADVGHGVSRSPGTNGAEPRWIGPPLLLCGTALGRATLIHGPGHAFPGPSVAIGGTRGMGKSAGGDWLARDNVARLPFYLGTELRPFCSHKCNHLLS